MLTEKQKQIARDAARLCKETAYTSIHLPLYAAVDAVLAEQTRAAEQVVQSPYDCCENGNFGEPHDCAKSQPAQPPAGDVYTWEQIINTANAIWYLRVKGTLGEFLELFRARLSPKPPEPSDVEKVTAILKKHEDEAIPHSVLAAEIVDALKAGKQ